MLTSEVLRAARGLIDTPEKWSKRGWGCGRTRCAMAAIEDVTGAEMVTETPAYAALERVAGCFVGHFNDRSTHADVMALFDRAIAQAEADENPEPTPNADTLTTVMAACDSLAGTVTDTILRDRPDLDRGVAEAYCTAELFCAAQDCAQMFTLSMEELAALRAAIRDSLGMGA